MWLEALTSGSLSANARLLLGIEQVHVGLTTQLIAKLGKRTVRQGQSRTTVLQKSMSLCLKVRGRYVNKESVCESYLCEANSCNRYLLANDTADNLSDGGISAVVVE